MNIEIEFDSLAEARAKGPQAILDRCIRDGLRLLESPTYCEREGRGVLSAEVAAPPSIPLEPNDSPAASVADQPEIDQ